MTFIGMNTRTQAQPFSIRNTPPAVSGHGNHQAPRNHPYISQESPWQYGGNPQQGIEDMMFLLINLLGSLFAGDQSVQNNNSDADWGCYTPPPQPPTCNHPSQPPVSCPEPPVYEEPPTYEAPKVLGSAGLFGDPKFGLFTPNMSNAPSALQSFDSGIRKGQTVTLLKDADQGGLQVTGTGVQVDPRNTKSIGIGSSTFKSGSDVVTIQGNGTLTVNGQNKGNINSSGLIAPITLSSGLKISTENAIDGPNGQTAERFVISNGEYKVTAAARKPHTDSAGYLDMNFEEKVADAADNATGFQANVPRLTQKYGIADLLRFEPDTIA